MAIRELLAEFTVNVATAPLDAAELQLESLQTSLLETAAQLDATQLELPEVPGLAPLEAPETPALGTLEAPDMPALGALEAPDMPGLEAPDMPALGTLEAPLVEAPVIPPADASEAVPAALEAPSVAAPVVPEADTTPTRAELEALAEQVNATIAAINANLILNPSLATEGTLTALAELEAQSDSVSAALSELDSTSVSADVTVDTDAAEAEVDKLAESIKGKLAAAAGAFGIAFGASTVVSWTGELLQAADAVGKTSQALGIGTDELQAWNTWASLNGSTAEGLKTGMRTLARNLDDFSRGTGAARDSLIDLGFAQDAFEGKSVSDAMRMVAGSVSEMDSDLEKAAAAQKLFGRAGIELIPALQGTREELDAALASFAESGVAFDSDFIAQAEAVNDEMDLMKISFQRTGATLLAGLIPVMRATVAVIEKITPHLDATTLGLGAVAAAAAFGGPALTKMGVSFATIGKTALGATRAVVRFALPFLVLEDIFTFLSGGESVLGDIIDGLFGVGAAGEVLRIVQDLWHGLTGAATVFWGFLTGDLDAAISGLTDKQIAGLEEWTRVWSDFGFFFSDLWSGFVAFVANSIANMTRSIADFVSNIPGIGDSLSAELNSFAQGISLETELKRSDRKEHGTGFAPMSVPEAPAATMSVAPVTNTSNVEITNSPKIEQNFTSVQPMTPQEVNIAGTRGLERVLTRSNKGIAKQAGVEI